MRKSEEFFTAINIWIGWASERESEEISFYDAILSWKKFLWKTLASESKAASSEMFIETMPAGATCKRLLFFYVSRKNSHNSLNFPERKEKQLIHARSLETKINFPNSMSIYQNKTFLSETNEVLNFNVFRIKRNICFVSRGMNFFFG